MGNSAADVLAHHGITGVDGETLEHYGVPGMKWGKRKANRKALKARNEQRAEARAKVKEMSDDDLKSAINRLKLEKEFKSLNAREISKGEEIVTKILTDVGTQTAKGLVSNGINSAIEGLMAPGALKTATKTASKLSTAAAPKAKRQVVQLNKTFNGKV